MSLPFETLRSSGLAASRMTRLRQSAVANACDYAKASSALDGGTMATAWQALFRQILRLCMTISARVGGLAFEILRVIKA